MITSLKDLILNAPRRNAPAEQASKCLQVQVHQETYAWLESIAGEHGIGGALDVMAEIHHAIERAADPLGGNNA